MSHPLKSKTGGNEASSNVAVIIPAYNEALTIRNVITCAIDCEYVTEIIVVDNGSSDDTAKISVASGAQVVRKQQRGKGQAIREGVFLTQADILVFLDADLIGITPNHIAALIKPILSNHADMVCGLFDRGYIFNPIFLHILPILTGQRALRRYIFDSLADVEIAGYRLEFALNAHVSYQHLRRIDFVCEGMTHRLKEYKCSNPLVGFLLKQKMILQALTGYFIYLIRRRLSIRLKDNDYIIG